MDVKAQPFGESFAILVVKKTSRKQKPDKNHNN